MTRCTKALFLIALLGGGAARSTITASPTLVLAYRVQLMPSLFLTNVASASKTPLAPGRCRIPVTDAAYLSSAVLKGVTAGTRTCDARETINWSGTAQFSTLPAVQAVLEFKRAIMRGGTLLWSERADASEEAFGARYHGRTYEVSVTGAQYDTTMIISRASTP